MEGIQEAEGFLRGGILHPFRRLLVEDPSFFLQLDSFVQYGYALFGFFCHQLTSYVVSFVFLRSRTILLFGRGKSKEQQRER